MKRNFKIGRYFDAAGVVASWLCMLHCLALPLVIGALPLVALSFLLEEATERVFIGISAALAALSLLPAYFREHGRLYSIVLAAGSVGLILLTHFAFEDRLILKIVFLLAGGVLLSAAHILNRRLCRACTAR